MTKEQDPLQEDINAVSALLRKCLNESADIVDTKLNGKDMTADSRAERIESIGALIFFKLMEPPGSSAKIWMPKD